ncbi:MAG TPA: RING finger protein [Chloroflexota bacterium]|nr:RING finger protein [Chloroflexota bacterium]
MASEQGDAGVSAPDERASDAVWYTRLFVWVGAGVIVLEALTGRSNLAVTVIGVVLLSAGLVGFVAALALAGRWPAILEPGQPNQTPEVPAAAEPFPPEATANESVAASTPEEAQAAMPPAAVGPPEPPASKEKPIAGEEPAPPEPVVERPEPPVAARSATLARGVPTSELDAVSPLLASFCPRCEQRFRADQVVATCPECSAVQHAACWAENRFHCARPGCGGRGSLEAPAGP